MAHLLSLSPSSAWFYSHPSFGAQERKGRERPTLNGHHPPQKNQGRKLRERKRQKWVGFFGREERENGGGKKEEMGSLSFWVG